MCRISNFSPRKTDSSRSLVVFIWKAGESPPVLVRKSDPWPCESREQSENNSCHINQNQSESGRSLMLKKKRSFFLCVCFPLHVLIYFAWFGTIEHPSIHCSREEHVGRNSYSTFFDKCYELLEVTTHWVATAGPNCVIVDMYRSV